MKILFGIVFSLFIASQETEILVAALANVGSDVLTSRDLQINQFLNEVDNPFKEYSDKPAPLKELVWEHLVYLESKKVFSSPVSDSEVDSFVSQFKAKVKGDGLWKSLDVSEEELLTAVKRKLNAKKLLKLKMPKNLIHVSETEVSNYYKQNKVQLGLKPQSEVEDRIKNGLQMLKARTRFYDWVATMSRSNNISYYSGFQIK